MFYGDALLDIQKYYLSDPYFEEAFDKERSCAGMNVLSFIHFVHNIHLLIALFHVTIACKCIHRVEQPCYSIPTLSRTSNAG